MKVPGASDYGYGRFRAGDVDINWRSALLAGFIFVIGALLYGAGVLVALTCFQASEKWWLLLGLVLIGWLYFRHLRVFTRWVYLIYWLCWCGFAYDKPKTNRFALAWFMPQLISLLNAQETVQDFSPSSGMQKLATWEFSEEAIEHTVSSADSVFREYGSDLDAYARQLGRSIETAKEASDIKGREHERELLIKEVADEVCRRLSERKTP